MSLKEKALNHLALVTRRNALLAELDVARTVIEHRYHLAQVLELDPDELTLEIEPRDGDGPSGWIVDGYAIDVRHNGYALVAHFGRGLRESGGGSWDRYREFNNLAEFARLIDKK